MKSQITIMCIFLSILIVSSVCAQKVYYWTDENGVMNATTTPPPDNIKKYEADSWGKGTKAEEEELEKRLQREDPRKAALIRCLIDAERTYDSDWDDKCKQLGRTHDCKLPFAYSDRIDSRRKEQKDDCYKFNSALK